jgi:predicted glutamine amidotransferase
LCGIVGVASRGAMTLQMKEFFTQLLYHDVVRGEHATGVAAIDTLDQSVEIFKKAMPAPLFLYEEGLEPLFDNKKNYNIYIGHNRYATSGDKKRDDFAHPFRHGHITGVHNGTIREQSLLEDHRLFDVDSDNLFYHMSVHGLDHTLQHLNGAFALVWYNSEDNTLNFLRNDERPLCIAVLNNECVVWASEMSMLRWLVRRHKTLSFKKQKVKDKDKEGKDYEYEVEMCYALEKGDHLSFGFQGRSIQKPLSVKKNLPTFPPITYYGYRNTNNYGTYNKWDPEPSYKHDKYNSDSVLTEANNMLKQANKSIYVRAVLGAKLIELIQPTSATGKQAALFEFVGGLSRFPVLLYNGGYDKVVEGLTADDVGRVYYGEITSAYTPTEYSEKKAINKYGELEYIFTFSNIDKHAPRGKGYFPYCQNKAEELGEVQKALEKKEKKEQVAALLTAPTKEEEKTSERKEESENSKSTVLKAVNSTNNPTVIVRLANAKISRLIMLDIVKENNFRCGCCCSVLSSVELKDIYLLKVKDHSDGQLANHLACSKKCHQELYTWAVDDCKDEVVGNG